MWCDKTMSDDWVYGAYIVQMMSTKDLRGTGYFPSYVIRYYGQPPPYSYSSLLGKAYSKAKTEFGLRLTKKVLTQVGIHLPNELATQEQIEDIISMDDHLWDICAEEERTLVQSEQLLFAGC
jgi:hypothetical protein